MEVKRGTIQNNKIEMVVQKMFNDEGGFGYLQRSKKGLLKASHDK